MGYKVLCGLSRKRFIKSLFGTENRTEADLEALDELTAQASLYFALNGVNIVRVHNVAKTKQALNLAEKLF